MAEFTDRKKKAADGGGGGAAIRDPRVEKAYPALWDFLTTNQTSDKKVRKTSTVLVFVEDGQWKACFTDRQDEMYFFLSADTAVGLLEALEKALEEDAVEWRKKKQWDGGKGKK